MAARIHAIVTRRRAGSRAEDVLRDAGVRHGKDGKTICFFQPKSKFKVRYSTFGFQPDAKIDDGEMWPIAFAVIEADARRREEDRRAREEGRRAEHRADGDWGAIEVRGARENNLRDVSLDIPKRRLTVFTGVSGSGKSSLVFGTIAAESQRLINETYSAFVQGFMPTLARPDVDSLEGLTTAIILDQERMGANVRSHRRHRDRRERDAAGRLQPDRRSRTSAGPRRSRSTSPRSRAAERSRSSAAPARPRAAASASPAACARAARAWAPRTTST